ncbi:hypothetical protein B0H13DRAFT_2300803 [Mycena leptocephala]|nr:hypothetical protein B0H13DRAFT_2300803 [Mycena leptocephala]
MSKPYLEAIATSFKDPNGDVKCLIATEGASNGFDVADVDLIVQFGAPKSIIDKDQRGGRELDIDSSEDEVEGNEEEEPDDGEEVPEESDEEEVFQYPRESVRDGDSSENDEVDLERQGDGAIANADRTTAAYVGSSKTRPRRSARLNPGLT